MRTRISVIALAAALVATTSTFAQLDLDIGGDGGVSVDVGSGSSSDSGSDTGSSSDSGSSTDSGSSGSDSSGSGASGGSDSGGGSDTGSGGGSPSDSGSGGSSSDTSSNGGSSAPDTSSTAPSDNSGTPSTSSGVGPNGGPLIEIGSPAPSAPAAPAAAASPAPAAAPAASPVVAPAAPVAAPAPAAPVVNMRMLSRSLLPNLNVPQILPTTPVIPTTPALPIAPIVSVTPPVVAPATTTPVVIPPVPVLSMDAGIRVDALVDRITNPVVNTNLDATVNDRAVSIVPVTNLVTSAGLPQVTSALQSSPEARTDLLNSITSSQTLTSVLNTQGINPSDVLAMHVSPSGSTELVVANGAINLSNLGTTVGNTLGTVVGDVGTAVGNVGTAVGDVGAAVSNSGAASGNAGTVANGLGTVLGDVGAAVGNAGAAVGNVGGAVSNPDAAAGNLGAAVDNLGAAVGNAGAAVGDVGAAVSNSGAASGNAGTVANGLGTVLGDVGAAVGNAGAAVGNVGGAVSNPDAAASNLGAAVDNLGAAVGNVGAAVGDVGATVGNTVGTVGNAAGNLLGPDGLGGLTQTQLADLNVNLLSENELVSADLSLLPNESQRVDAVVRLLGTGSLLNQPPAPTGPARVFDIAGLLGANAQNILGGALGPRPVIDPGLQLRLDALGIDANLVVAVRTEADGTLRIFTDANIGTGNNTTGINLNVDPLVGLTPTQLADLNVSLLTDQDLARVDLSLLPNSQQRVDAVLRILGQNGPTTGTPSGTPQIVDLNSLVGTQGIGALRQALGLPQGAATLAPALVAQLQSLGVDVSTVLAATTDLAGNLRVFVDPSLSVAITPPASGGGTTPSQPANLLDPLAGFSQTQLAGLDIGLLTDQQLIHTDLQNLPNVQQRVDALLRILDLSAPVTGTPSGPLQVLDLSNLVGAQGIDAVRQALGLPQGPVTLDPALVSQLQALGVDVSKVLAATTDLAGNTRILLDPALNAVAAALPTTGGGTPTLPASGALAPVLGGLLDPLAGLTPTQLANLDIGLLNDQDLARIDLTLLPNSQQRVDALVRILAQGSPLSGLPTGQVEVLDLASLLNGQGLDAVRQALGMPQGPVAIDQALAAALQAQGIDVSKIVAATTDLAGNTRILLDNALTAVTTPPTSGGGTGTLPGSLPNPLAGLTPTQLANLNINLLTDQDLARIDLTLLPNNQQRVDALVRIFGQGAPLSGTPTGPVEVINLAQLLGSQGLDAVRQALGMPQGPVAVDPALAAQLQSLGFDVSKIAAVTTDLAGNTRILLDDALSAVLNPPASGGGTGTLPVNLLDPLAGLTQTQLANLNIALLSDQDLARIDVSVLPNSQQRLDALVRILGQGAPVVGAPSGPVQILDLPALLGPQGLGSLLQTLGLTETPATLDPALAAQLQSLGVDVSKVLSATTDVAGNLRILLDPALTAVTTPPVVGGGSGGGTGTGGASGINLGGIGSSIANGVGSLPGSLLDPLAGLTSIQLATLDIGLLTNQELARVNLQLLPNEQQRLGVILRLLQIGAPLVPGGSVPGALQIIDLNALLGNQSLDLIRTLLHGTGDDLIDLSLNPQIVAQLGSAGIDLDTVAALRIGGDGQLQVFLNAGLGNVASAPGTGGGSTGGGNTGGGTTITLPGGSVTLGGNGSGGTGGNTGGGNTGGGNTGGGNTGGGNAGGGNTGGGNTGGGSTGGGTTITLPGGTITIGGNGSGGTGGGNTGGGNTGGGNTGGGNTGGGNTGGGSTGGGGGTTITLPGGTVTIGGNGSGGTGGNGGGTGSISQLPGGGGTGSGGNGGGTNTAGNPTTSNPPGRPVIRFQRNFANNNSDDMFSFSGDETDDPSNPLNPMNQQGATNLAALGINPNEISQFAELDCAAGVSAMMRGGVVVPATVIGATHLELVRVNGCQQEISVSGIDRLRGAIEGNAGLLQSLLQSGIPVDDIIGATMDGPIITLFVEQPMI